MKILSLTVCLGLLASLAQAASLSALSLSALPPREGVTRLLLAAQNPQAIEPASRVRVSPGEEVWLVAPEDWNLPIQWTKNGQPISGATGRTWILPWATTADVGRYTLVSEAGVNATEVVLDVQPQGQLSNVSTLEKLAPGDTRVMGFVVTGPVSKNLLVRAVGPSLAEWVTGPTVQEPRIRFFDAEGKPFGWVRPAVVLPPDYWERVFEAAGAFPLTGGEVPELAFDFGPFPPGVYTVHVSDDAGEGGLVLIELYELQPPQSIPVPEAP